MAHRLKHSNPLVMSRMRVPTSMFVTTVPPQLISLLNKGVTPVACTKGSVGACGDLAPMSQIALLMMGEGEAFYRGERLPGDHALEKAGIPPRIKRLLLKTSNSDLWARGETIFQTDFVGVNKSGSEWLVRKGVQLVGVDYLSIAPFKQSKEPHQILLGAGIVILEGLNLNEVSQGRYNLCSLPIKLIGSDGAPARAILTGV